jgi:hypothetical protein
VFHKLAAQDARTEGDWLACRHIAGVEFLNLNDFDACGKIEPLRWNGDWAAGVMSAGYT